MRKVWNILTHLCVIVLAIVGFLMVAHTVVCHSDNTRCGHRDDGCATTECVCVCHAALEPAENPELCFPERGVSVSFEYVTVLGTSVPADIFRPPLARS